MEFLWLGRQSYSLIESLQKEKALDIRGSEKVLVLGIEFNPVITFGIRGKPENDLLDSLDSIQSKGYEIQHTDRGGQATLHQPGQLVIYPMLDLKHWKWGVKDFMNSLMGASIRSLENYSIAAYFDPQNPGLYTSKGKIGFCGLKVDQGVVRHGISINVSNELSDFHFIRSCGLSKPVLDRVQNYQDLDLPQLFVDWVEEFRKDFPLSAPKSIDMTSSL